MKIRTWHNGIIFLVSCALAILLTPLLYPVYNNLFNPSGSWIISGEIEAFSLTPILLYIFFLCSLYTTFSRKPNLKTAFYFLILPLLIFILGGIDQTTLTAVGFLVAGILLGKVIRSSFVVVDR